MKHVLPNSLLVLALGAHLAHGAEPSVITIESIEGPNWSLDMFRLAVDFGAAGGPTAELDIARASLPAPLGELEHLAIRCGRIQITPRRFECAEGKLSGTVNKAYVEFALGFTYRVLDRRLEFDLPAIPYADGQVRIKGRIGGAGLSFELRGVSLALSAVARDLDGALDSARDITVDTGSLDFDSRWRFAPDGAIRAEGHAAVRDLAFNDPTGRFAAEALNMDLEIEVASGSAEGAWETDVKIKIGTGGVYAEPVYVDFSEHPLVLTASAIIEPVAGRIEIPRFHVTQPEVIILSGRLVSSREKRLEHAVVEIESARFPVAYDTYLKGFLVGTPFDRLDTEGKLKGRIEIEQDQPVGLSLEVKTLNLEDADGRFAMYGARGNLDWRRDAADAALSRFAFDGGFVYGAGFDASSLQLRIAGTGAELTEPARIPALGGALDIKAFKVSDWDSDDITFDFEADLKPIELRQLTVALGWPAFAGTLSGRLPLLRYRQGVVTLGGTLEARAFDGDVTIEDLRIDRPFGIVPAVSATIRLRNLDLGLVTEVFSFGSVAGRLDGDIEDLKMLKGEPIAFNASFRTPENDRSKHRISQRAIGTISKVAGGSGTVLSSTFLSVFKDFPYDRLGISCRLESDICHMDGIEDADAGYYIVKGSLLPRLDLIGRVRAVNWSRLMSQLKQALEEGQLNIE
ncbi:MAG: hypothetical protein O7G83_03830 [Proteobacteria bacterium]|nr:hypothetical protein [Pseudomonadota bacterium]